MNFAYPHTDLLRNETPTKIDQRDYSFPDHMFKMIGDGMQSE
jgi:hypothetical protein